jgi:hypothetical protein
MMPPIGPAPRDIIKQATRNTVWNDTRIATLDAWVPTWNITLDVTWDATRELIWESIEAAL